MIYNQMNVKKVRNEQRKIILKVKERFENKSYSKDNNSDLYFLMDALYNVTKLELGLQGCEAYTTSLPNQRIRYNIKSLFDFILNSPKMLNSGEQEKQVNKSKHVEKKGKSQIRIKFVNSDETKNRNGMESEANGKYAQNDYNFYKAYKKIVFNTDNLFENISSDDKNERMVACERIFQTAFHEIRHARQFQLANMNISDEKVLNFAREEIINSVLGIEWMERNYDHLSMEKDANITAIRKMNKIVPNYQGSTYDYKTEKLLYNNSYFISDNNSKEDCFLAEKNLTFATILDEIMLGERRKPIFESFPILKKIYNDDGHKKSVSELANEMEYEISKTENNIVMSKKDKDKKIAKCENFYHEIIFEKLFFENEEERNETYNSMDKEKLKSLVHEIYDIYSRKDNNLKNELEGNEGYLDLFDLYSPHLEFLENLNEDLDNGKYEYRKTLHYNPLKNKDLTLKPRENEKPHHSIFITADDIKKDTPNNFRDKLLYQNHNKKHLNNEHQNSKRTETNKEHQNNDEMGR